MHAAGSKRESKAVLALGVLFAVGCSDELDLPPIRYQTEHLRIGTDFTTPVCAGSIDRLEQHVQRLERLLDTEVSEPIELYWFTGSPPCGPGDRASGCYVRESGIVLTQYGSARHELAHAVSYLWGDPDRFYGEGVAQAFSGERSSFGEALPSASLGRLERVPTDDAAHFIRWLYERKGPRPLRTLFERSHQNDRPSAERAFIAAYGEPISQLEQLYYAEAPEHYPGFSWCFDDVEVLPWQGDYWLQSIELDCEATHTRGTEAMTRTVAFDVARAGRFTFEIEAPARAYLTTCQTEVIDKGQPDLSERGPVGEEPGGSVFSVGTWIESGRGVELGLYAGRYRIAIEVVPTGKVTVRAYLGPRLTGTTVEQHSFDE